MTSAVTQHIAASGSYHGSVMGERRNLSGRYPSTSAAVAEACRQSLTALRFTSHAGKLVLKEVTGGFQVEQRVSTAPRSPVFRGTLRGRQSTKTPLSGQDWHPKSIREDKTGVKEGPMNADSLNAPALFSPLAREVQIVQNVILVPDLMGQSFFPGSDLYAVGALDDQAVPSR